MRSLHFLLAFLLTTLSARGQCPVVNFTVPDTICAGDPVTILNLSTVNSTPQYQWDFNAADLRNTPVGSMVGTYASLIPGSLGVDFGFDNGNYYGFVINTGGILSRYDFGNSISNTPTAVNLGNLGVLTGGSDFRLIQENGLWYGITNSFSGPVSRIDFGNSLANTPTAVNLNVNPALFFTAYYMSVEKINNQYIAMIANYSSGNITVLDFGSSITNLTPNAFNIMMSSANPISVVIGSDCDQIYGYVGFGSAAPIAQLSFGSTINSNPVITAINGPVNSYRKIDLISDGSGYSIFAHVFGGEVMHEYRFGNDLGNLNPSFENIGAFNAMISGAYTFSVNKVGSQTIGLITNYNNGDLTRFILPESNPESGSVSTDAIPSLTYSEPGYHVIQLTVTDSISGISEYLTDSLYVNELPEPGFSWTNACEGAQVEFVDTTSGTGNSSVWTFSSGGSATGDTVYHQLPSAGTYNVTLTVTTPLGCSSGKTEPVTVFELPSAQFTFNNNECAESEIQFLNTSSVSQGNISSYSWDFGDTFLSNDTNPVHTYLSHGTYQVQLAISANGCPDTLIQQAIILEKPAASFTIANTCIGESTLFQNTTTIANNVDLAFNWDLDNSILSTDTNPTNTYPLTPADYTVTLIANALNGCSDTSAVNLRIGNKASPTFLLSTDTACAGNPVQLTNLSLPAIGETILAYFWDFGDNTFDSLSLNPTHSYANPGTYTIRLTVRSVSACDTSVTKVLEVIDSPDAIFLTDTVCEGITTMFIDLSTTPAGTSIQQWQWDFGDSGSSSAAHPSHLYSAHGVYSVQLQVTNNAGCYNSITQSVIVKEKPVAAFGSTLACSGSPVQFTDSSTSGPALNSWEWDFGNGQNSGIQNPSTQYATSAVYPVTLIAGNTAGCYDTLTKIKLVQQSPEFTITVNDDCLGSLTDFSFQPIGIPTANPGYLWNFGDNTFSLQPNTTHLYASPGNYFSSLTITDLNNGCTRLVSDSVYIHPKPVADFLPDSVCLFDTLTFMNQSSISSGQITGYDWTLGSYGNSALENPQLITTAPDSFTVELIVTSGFGCKDTMEHIAEIYPNPISNFTASSYFGAPPLFVSFNNNSSQGTYFWNFGDNTSSTLEEPTHTYSDTGVFTITLLTSSARGCQSIYSNSITVQEPILDLAIENVSFTQSGGYWILGARVKNNGNTPLHTFDLAARLDGRSAIAETFEDTLLAPLQSLLLTFSTRFPVENGTNPKFLCLNVESVNNEADIHTGNNERCISTLDEFSIIGIYPNPATIVINGNYNLPAPGNSEISLLDSQGRTIHSEIQLNGLKGINSFYIPSQHLSAGIYLLKVRYNDKELIEKVMIH